MLDAPVAIRLLMLAEEAAFTSMLQELPEQLTVPLITIVFAEALSAHEAPPHDTVPANDIEQSVPTHDKLSWFEVAVTVLPDARVTDDDKDDMLRSGVLIVEPDESVTCFVVVPSGAAPTDDSRSDVVRDVVVSIEPCKFSDWNDSTTAAP